MNSALPLRALAVLAALICSGKAEAHAFDTGADQYAQFIEGVGVILASPETLLPLAALGILISLWQPEGLLRVWPVFLIGQAIGIPLAAAIGPWVVPTVQGAGLLIAVWAALMQRHARIAVIVASLTLGALVMMASLEGHGLLELPVAIHLGIFFGINLSIAMVAGMARFAIEQVDTTWMRILWRIAASWLAAILVLLFAFNFVAT